jgi:hypothetical protein
MELNIYEDECYYEHKYNDILFRLNIKEILNIEDMTKEEIMDDFGIYEDIDDDKEIVKISKSVIINKGIFDINYRIDICFTITSKNAIIDNIKFTQTQYTFNKDYIKNIKIKPYILDTYFFIHENQNSIIFYPDGTEKIGKNKLLIFVLDNKIRFTHYISHYKDEITNELLEELNNNIDKIRYDDNQGHGYDVSINENRIFGTDYLYKSRLNEYRVIIEKCRN